MALFGKKINADDLYAKGMKLYQEEKYYESAKLIMQAADMGHVNAMYREGFMYMKGQGMAQRTSDALSCFKKAAEKNHADAAYYLGYIYINGNGVPQDLNEAFIWFRNADRLGHKSAKETLEQINRLVDARQAKPKTAADYANEILGEKVNTAGTTSAKAAAPEAVKTVRTAALHSEAAQPLKVKDCLLLIKKWLGVKKKNRKKKQNCKKRKNGTTLE